MRSIVLRTLASVPVAAVALLAGYALVEILRFQPPKFTVILVIGLIGLLQLAFGLAVALVLAWLRPSLHPAGTALVASAVFLIAWVIGCFDSGIISIFETAQIVIFAVVLAIVCCLVRVVSTGRLSSLWTRSYTTLELANDYKVKGGAN